MAAHLRDGTVVLADHAILATGHAAAARGRDMARGLARIDPLRLSLEVTEESLLLSATGALVEQISAIGPLTRATFWEITAIPDIRLQAQALAAALCPALPPDQARTNFSANPRKEYQTAEISAS